MCQAPWYCHKLSWRHSGEPGGGIDAGKIVYVHCWGGKGRTGTGGFDPSVGGAVLSGGVPVRVSIR